MKKLLLILGIALLSACSSDNDSRIDECTDIVYDLEGGCTGADCHYFVTHGVTQEDATTTEVSQEAYNYYIEETCWIGTTPTE